MFINYLFRSKTRWHPSVFFQRATAVIVRLRLSLIVELVTTDDRRMAMKLAWMEVLWKCLMRWHCYLTRLLTYRMRSLRLIRQSLRICRDSFRLEILIVHCWSFLRQWRKFRRSRQVFVRRQQLRLSLTWGRLSWCRCKVIKTRWHLMISWHWGGTSDRPESRTIIWLETWIMSSADEFFLVFLKI